METLRSLAARLATTAILAANPGWPAPAPQSGVGANGEGRSALPPSAAYRLGPGDVVGIAVLAVVKFVNGP